MKPKTVMTIEIKVNPTKEVEEFIAYARALKRAKKKLKKRRKAK